MSGRVLPCGCLAGTYATWTNDIVVIVDARGTACQEDGHATNTIL